MPDGIANKLDRHADLYAWVRAQAALLAELPKTVDGIDLVGLREYLEESAEGMSRAVESHLANLISHVTKAALTRNPQVIQHWLSESGNFHDEIELAYRRSMARDIQMDRVWRLACKKVLRSFKEHGEPKPNLPAECPFELATLVDPDLDIEALVATMKQRYGG